MAVDSGSISSSSSSSSLSSASDSSMSPPPRGMAAADKAVRRYDPFLLSVHCNGSIDECPAPVEIVLL